MNEETFDLIGRYVGGIIIGLLWGGAPLIVSIFKKKLLYGVIGAVACVVFGPVCLVVLNIPVIFTLVLATVFVFIVLFVPYPFGKRK